MSQLLANIHPNAKIGQNVVIEPFATVGDNVEIGDGTWIGPNAVIMSGARIGKNCKIFPGAVIAGVPMDLKFMGEESLAIIGDNTTVREFVTINRGTKATGVTSVGENCFIMCCVHIAHDCRIGNNVILVGYAGAAGFVNIDDWAIVSGHTAIHQFVNIGAHSYIAGGSLVRKDVPPFVKAAREPLAFVGINSVGLRRRGYSNDQIKNVQDVYKIVFQSGYSLTHALKHLETEVPESPEKDLVLSFIKNSKRGLMKGYTPGQDDEDL